MNFEIENYSSEQLDNMMSYVPGGKFIFGLTEEQKVNLAKKSAVHPDMLYFHTDYQLLETAPFWIDKYPVTRGQFLRFMDETGYKIQYNGWLVGWTELTNWQEFSPESYPLPMVGVNSADAEAYANWLGKRIPAELEWEKAFRGTDGRLYPWGNSFKEGCFFRNQKGNTSLKLSIPVGVFPELGPYGLKDFGLVLEWVRTSFTPKSKTGKTDNNNHILAGGSFLHTKEYSFLPTNRSSWSSGMRIYNGGFRCVSDKKPAGLVNNVSYKVSKFVPLEPIKIRKELYLKEKIRLIPTGWATFSIFVPWFPESVWVLDCPESNWDEFGGANAWPDGPEETWRIDWKVNSDGSKISYLRQKDDKKIFFEAVVEGPTVKYQIKVVNVQDKTHREDSPSPIDLGTFCLKTFSPFFGSQERVTQVKLVLDTLSCLQDRPGSGSGKVVRCCEMPIADDHPASFNWSLGNITTKDHAMFLSYDGTAKVVFPEDEYAIYGNGWVPCTHIRGRKTAVNNSAGSSISFLIDDGF